MMVPTCWLACMHPCMRQWKRHRVQLSWQHCHSADCGSCLYLDRSMSARMAQAQQKRPRKAPAKAEVRPLTQEELLAEAAQTELENSASVALLMAAEEEVKARAAVRRGAYAGPLLRYRSKQVNGEAVVRSCSWFLATAQAVAMSKPSSHL